jgi:hypothetical protein
MYLPPLVLVLLVLLLHASWCVGLAVAPAAGAYNVRDLLRCSL